MTERRMEALRRMAESSEAGLAAAAQNAIDQHNGKTLARDDPEALPSTTAAGCWSCSTGSGGPWFRPASRWTMSGSKSTSWRPGIRSLRGESLLRRLGHHVEWRSMNDRDVRLYEIIESGSVWHWVAAQDEAQARGIVVGAVLGMGTEEESSEAEWEIAEVDPERAAKLMVLDDDSIKDGVRRPMSDYLDKPQYVACSEY